MAAATTWSSWGKSGRSTSTSTRCRSSSNRPDYAPVVESLRGVGINSEIDLFGTYAGQKSDLGDWTEGAEINRDNDLRLQYLGGWGINSRMEDFIYRRMLAHRQTPTNIFRGSPEHVMALLQAIQEGR